MTKEQAIWILDNEKKCICRAATTKCDRDCASCELVLPDDAILEAYKYAEDAINLVSDLVDFLSLKLRAYDTNYDDWDVGHYRAYKDIWDKIMEKDL